MSNGRPVMKKKTKSPEPAAKRAQRATKLEFAIENEPLASSSSVSAVGEPHATPRAVKADVQTKGKPLTGEPVSPVFAALERPILPELPRNDRARLQMQSPNRLYFYWSLGGNPYQKLRKATGSSTGTYSLVVRLLDLHRNATQIYQVESEGTWWFDVESGSEYRAEIGFYAPNRPFVRILFSNTVETPRIGPSPHAASESDWKVPAQDFSYVLQAAGFARDAFEVALTGEDARGANRAARDAWTELAGMPPESGGNYAELRYALFAIASGLSLDELRARIGPRLFAFVAENAEKLVAGNIAAAIEKYFLGAEIYAGVQSSSSVFGASLVNFPTRPGFGRKILHDFKPDLPGSHSFGFGKIS